MPPVTHPTRRHRGWLARCRWLCAGACALAVLLAPVPVNAARPPPPSPGESGEIPEDSRWISFVRLIESQWRTRVAVPPASPGEARSHFWQCVEDAWYLAAPGLLAGRESPCARLISAMPRSAEEGPSRAVHDRYRELFGAAAAPPRREDFRACAGSAAGRGDPALLTTCARALTTRAGRVARMPDAERFSSWLGGCKRVLLADVQLVPAGDLPVAPGTAPSPADEEQARHCLRQLPAMYEVRPMRRLSDYWTPEEQRALHLRAQQLAQP